MAQVAAITAASVVASSLLKAKQDKKKRQAEARAAVAEAQMESGKGKSKALQDIIGNFRAALL